jgi:TolB-like protein
MSRFFLILVLILAALLFPLAAAAFFETGTVPVAANSIADQLDSQLMMRYAGNNPDMKKSERKALARSRISIMGTTAANINNLEETSPLGRQITEEIAHRLMDAGYRFTELRKGRHIRFNNKGEFFLTRDLQKLAGTTGTAQAVLAGTYVVTPAQVRFSMRLIHVNSNEVLAMGTATVPITDDVEPLLEDMKPGSGSRPSVHTRLE